MAIDPTENSEVVALALVRWEGNVLAQVASRLDSLEGRDGIGVLLALRLIPLDEDEVGSVRSVSASRREISGFPLLCGESGYDEDGAAGGRTEEVLVVVVVVLE